MRVSCGEGVAFGLWRVETQGHGESGTKEDSGLQLGILAMAEDLLKSCLTQRE